MLGDSLRGFQEGKAVIYERAGEFLARVKLGTGSVGCHHAMVEEWLGERERGVTRPLVQ
jgi:hypothetical protein